MAKTTSVEKFALPLTFLMLSWAVRFSVQMGFNARRGERRVFLLFWACETS
jgi:hypothetical protein